MNAHERSSLHTQAKPSSASHIKTARKREQSCSEISCTLHSLSYPAPYCSRMTCRARELQVSVENASRNAVYTSWGAVVDIIKALGTWVEESIKRLQKALVSVMADECTDITTVEELSVLCCLEDDGNLVEGFLDIVPLKKADAESIYLALVKCIKDKNLQVGNIVGMGFEVLPSFLIKWLVGVPARQNKHTPHAVFVQSLSPPAISLRASCQ